MESIGGKTAKELLDSQITSDNRGGEEVYITGLKSQLTLSQLGSLLLFQVATVATSQDGTLTYRRHEDAREQYQRKVVERSWNEEAKLHDSLRDHRTDDVRLR
jgi:hypothetical protein